MPECRILVIDGNVAALRERLTAALGYHTAQGYAAVLRRIEPRLDCHLVYPADGIARLPEGVELGDFAGAVVTGSALNLYNGGAEVERQIELARAVFTAGVPFFGSCWGLQVAVTAAGGRVRANPRGREFGFARRIELTQTGRQHPMYRGKPPVFEALTVHRDDIETLPDGAVVLATNDMGLQAAAFRCGKGSFWGAQYHPEYSYRDIAGAATRYGQVLVDDGLFTHADALVAWVEDLRALQAEPADRALLWKHGLGPAMGDESLRQVELRNWLHDEVLTHCR